MVAALLQPSRCVAAGALQTASRVAAAWERQHVEAVRLWCAAAAPAAAAWRRLEEACSPPHVLASAR